MCQICNTDGNIYYDFKIPKVKIACNNCGWHTHASLDKKDDYIKCLSCSRSEDLVILISGSEIKKLNNYSNLEKILKEMDERKEDIRSFMVEHFGVVYKQ